MAAFQLTVQTAVRGYHVYKEVWVPTVDKELYFRQEADNREGRYAVAVYGDTQSSTHTHACKVLGHLLRQILRVSFITFLEHDGTIMGRETENSSQLGST